MAALPGDMHRLCLPTRRLYEAPRRHMSEFPPAQRKRVGEDHPTGMLVLSPCPRNGRSLRRRASGLPKYASLVVAGYGKETPLRAVVLREARPFGNGCRRE